jgi:predicted nucleic acid-binding Zn ribbon protein
VPRCQLCQVTFEAQKPTARFCSSKCRSASWQRERARVQAEREGRVRALLAEALRMLSDPPDRITP